MRPWLAFAISRNWSAIQARAANTPRWLPSFSENVFRVPKATSFVSIALSLSAETFATAAAIAGSWAGAGAARAAPDIVRQASVVNSLRIDPPIGRDDRTSVRCGQLRRGASGASRSGFRIRPPSFPLRRQDGACSRFSPIERGASMSTERDYVLGTHHEEIERLGLQHRVWLPRASDAWRRAGFSVGHTLLDVGCGPGWATLDLAGIAGPTGRAIGIDRSRRFLDAARARARAIGCAQAEFHELDLDEQPLPNVRVDGIWSRWVYAFVKDPRALLARVAALLKPGGTMVLHEYVDYRSWRVSPPRPEFAWFVEQ